jgi:hypothetical protein
MSKRINITEIVDQIGTLKAQIAPLEKQLKDAQNALKALGDGKYEGVLFDATVFTQVRELLDMQAARAKLSPQFIAAHTTESTSVVCKVTAKQLAIAA